MTKFVPINIQFTGLPDHMSAQICEFLNGPRRAKYNYKIHKQKFNQTLEHINATWIREHPLNIRFRVIEAIYLKKNEQIPNHITAGHISAQLFFMRWKDYQRAMPILALRRKLSFEEKEALDHWAQFPWKYEMPYGRKQRNWLM